jgi:hypothetical protein
MPAFENAVKHGRCSELNSVGSITVQASFTRFACENFVLASRVQISKRLIKEMQVR